MKKKAMKNNHYLQLLPDLPDNCLANIFGFLDSVDLKSCSLVCRDWFRVEGQSRDCLSLSIDANSKFKLVDLITVLPSLFIRFDSITTISLKSPRQDGAVLPIDDSALVLIALNCRYLTCLKLRTSSDLIVAGMADFAQYNYDYKGLNAVLHHCSLEELSVEDVVGFPLEPGLASNSLKTICITSCDCYTFKQLIAASKNLRTLKINNCRNSDHLFVPIVKSVIGLVEIHLESTGVRDATLFSISNSLDLEILHLSNNHFITNAGLVSVADKCKLLKKLYIYGRENKIGDEGLTAIARSCRKLQELSLFHVNVTCLSMDLLAANCQNLKRLVVVRSKTFGDAEILCIAAKCIALRYLGMLCCPVSDRGLKVLSGGLPSLVNLNISHCKNVTQNGIDRLKADRRNLFIHCHLGDQF